MGRVRKVLTGPLAVAVLVVAVAGVGFGLYWFQPWKLWQDETVEEALPGVVETSVPPTAAAAAALGRALRAALGRRPADAGEW